ncbi:glycosyltransferase family 4 protein [Streptomyces sp. NBC_00083]|uniref:glycosyltransferase family 4 protein n=1 Tax=Streptomyces sp. NBC_00083 TaxID=2975647 RepID=UPI0022577F44|nr:glycosyltransferase family 4 protein [Streptomyces sp. NBC_00083]MCX5387344.1 glycosyltransferase family 4 protein [Streptomyces sp. NBC_00083]
MEIVLTVSDQVWGGKHRYMHDMAVGLARSGHSVTVLAEDGGAMLRQCRADGVLSVGVPVFAEGGAVEAVQEALRRRRPRIVCVTGRADAAAVHRARSLGAHDAAVVLFRHSAFPLGTTDEVRGLFSGVDLVFATSREQRKRQFEPLMDAGVLVDGQVELLTSGVGEQLLSALDAADRNAARRELGADEGQFVFLVLSRLAWEKGVDRVIDAFADIELPQGAPTPLLVIAGDGPLETDLRDQAVERGVADRVRFVGHLDDVAPVIAASDAVVLASTVPETGPLALKEAMAAGRPVIASAQGGIPEFVEDERHGLLAVDDEDLRQAMQRLVGDRAFARTLGAAAAESIRGGHRAVRRVEYLVHRLDLLVLDRFGPEPVLDEVAWDDVRLRGEAEGGFVFVPRTSHIMELGSDAYDAVRAAAEAGDPRLLLKLTDGDPGVLARRLYAMGALIRPGREPAPAAGTPGGRGPAPEEA